MAQPTILTADNIKIAFERVGDRFTHRVGLSGPEGPLWVLTSIEGSALDPRPASPPLQELHLEERPGGIQVALLVGMAGNSHWSASCQSDPRVGQVQFDIACRIKSEPEQLGSMYEVAPEIALRQESGHGVVESATGTLHFECQNETTLENPAKSQLAFLAQLPQSVPQTVQWRYRFWSGS